MPLTITEALAEIKTIGKRLQAKGNFIQTAVYRSAALRDPYEKDGGSVEVIRRERQAVSDLQSRIVVLRRAIDLANQSNEISIAGTTRSISEWLVWRRDVAPTEQAFLARIRQIVNGARQEAQRAGSTVTKDQESAANPRDIIVNLNEAELNRQIEDLENVLGTLDGQLSLKNATVIVKDM